MGCSQFGCRGLRTQTQRARAQTKKKQQQVRPNLTIIVSEEEQVATQEDQGLLFKRKLDRLTNDLIVNARNVTLHLEDVIRSPNAQTRKVPLTYASYALKVFETSTVAIGNELGEFKKYVRETYTETIAPYQPPKKKAPVKKPESSKVDEEKVAAKKVKNVRDGSPVRKTPPPSPPRTPQGHGDNQGQEQEALQLPHQEVGSPAPTNTPPRSPQALANEEALITQMDLVDTQETPKTPVYDQ